MMLDTIDIIRKKATQQLDQSKRSEFGQYMTPGIVAKFLVSLFQNVDLEYIHLLDAGAGIGSLVGAFLDKKIEKKGKSKTIKITAYEINDSLAFYLKTNLISYYTLLSEKEISLETEIFINDFIKEASLKIVSKKKPVFTHAILNPPYKKIHSDSDHRKLLRSAGLEIVNLYAAFVALSLALLQDKGELVAIIPRSFCNGNYYKPFRDLIFEKSAIKRIHLFESRNDAFKDDEVLQENMIIHLIKGEKQENVTITLSADASLQDWQQAVYPFSQIVKPGDTEKFIHIPHHGENRLEDCSFFNYTLTDLSVEVSTGPVVDFRVKEHTSLEHVKNSVPLLYPIHFNGKEIDWPKAGKKPNAIAINSDTQKMLYPIGFYVVVRRFSSKEEKQRIIARVINPNSLDFDYIGIENHLNVIHSGKKGISEYLAYGLAAYLNSTYVDTHFRSFNGHTQVNATDLRQMKYASKKALISLGKWARKLKSFEPQKIDERIDKML